MALQLDLHRILVSGASFFHVVYLNPAARTLSQVRTARLHVYLEGDGDPWLTRYQIAADPTPRNPLTLRLLARDPGPAIYLGRPCYHGLALRPPCSPALWTSHRYSEAVVHSMALALRQLPVYQACRDMVLIGHSGGGALAMLLAPRLAKTTAVITLAGNLDPSAWTRLHGYSDLSASLNPAHQPLLPERIKQIHLFGQQDQNIPPYLAPERLLQQSNVRMVKLEAYNHTCCWLENWPLFLAYFQSTLE